MITEKKLCIINDSEARRYSETISKKQTFIILKNLMLEQQNTNDIEYIEKKISEYSLQLNHWWEEITEKYGIPYFLDNSLGVDLNKNEIFIRVNK